MKVMCRGQGSVTEARRPAEGNQGLMGPGMCGAVAEEGLAQLYEWACDRVT